MDNFIFSINATLPVFVVIFAGMILRRVGIVDKSFVASADKICFKLAIPMMLFIDISKSDLSQMQDFKFVFYCFAPTTLSVLLIWVFSAKFLKRKESVGAFIQSSFRGSAAILGTAFVYNIYGNAGMAPLMIAIVVPIYNIYSVLILSYYGNDKSQRSFKRIVKNIIKNPIIIGVVLGLIYLNLGLDFPAVVMKSISNFAALATPLALLSIGAAFDVKDAFAKMHLTIGASLIKLIIQPLIFIPIAAFLGFRDQSIIAILIMLASPATMTGYVMAKVMHNDAPLTSSVIVATTLFSSLTMTMWIYILRIFGLV